MAVKLTEEEKGARKGRRAARLALKKAALQLLKKEARKLGWNGMKQGRTSKWACLYALELELTRPRGRRRTGDLI